MLKVTWRREHKPATPIGFKEPGSSGLWPRAVGSTTQHWAAFPWPALILGVCHSGHLNMLGVATVPYGCHKSCISSVVLWHSHLYQVHAFPNLVPLFCRSCQCIALLPVLLSAWIWAGAVTSSREVLQTAARWQSQPVPPIRLIFESLTAG